MIAAQTRAKVERISPLTDSVIEIVLKPEKYIDYQAGQYLQIVLEKEYLCYSIANAPLGSHQYELHIRHEKNNPYTQALLAEIKQEGSIQLYLPLGDCHIQQLHPEKPILFLAVGTGFAPIKAMIEQMLADSDQRSFELYWSARNQSDLYMDEKVKLWQSHVQGFCYFSSLPSTHTKDRLSTWVTNHHPHNLQNYQIVIAGPFESVLATREALMLAGVSAADMYSDAFSFKKKE